MKKYIGLVILIMIFPAVQGQEIAQKAFSEGVQLLKSNQYIEAEKQFSIAIENGQTRKGLKMSYIYKGFDLNGQSKFDEAISNFDKAIELDSLDAASFSDRAKAYSYKNDYENAIKDFNKVLEFDSIGEQAEAAYYYLGRIKSLQFNYEEAIAYFDKLIMLVPTDAEGYFLRGTIKSNLMDNEGSIEDFDMAIKYKPDYMEAYANRGVQKINAIPVNKKVGKKIKCLEEPCADLLKAKELGDSTVDDMIYLYCKKCK